MDDTGGAAPRLGPARGGAVKGFAPGRTVVRRYWRGGRIGFLARELLDEIPYTLATL